MVGYTGYAADNDTKPQTQLMRNKSEDDRRCAGVLREDT